MFPSPVSVVSFLKHKLYTLEENNNKLIVFLMIYSGLKLSYCLLKEKCDLSFNDYCDQPSLKICAIKFASDDLFDTPSFFKQYLTIVFGIMVN